MKKRIQIPYVLAKVRDSVQLEIIRFRAAVLAVLFLTKSDAFLKNYTIQQIVLPIVWLLSTFQILVADNPAHISTF